MTTANNHRGIWVLAVLLMGLFITNVDVAVVNVATPSIHTHLDASASALQLVVSGYVLSYAMLLITGARLGGMYGYRRLFLIGLVIFTIASLICGLAPSAMVLVLARVVQGSGAALMVPQVLIGIQLNFHGAMRTRALGLYSVALSMGAVAGQVLGGLLISANLFGTAWRPIFLINLPVGLVVMIAALAFLPSSPPHGAQRLDLLGVGTLSATVLLALLPLILGHTEHWPIWVWLSLIASVVPFVTFLRVERGKAKDHSNPLINVRVVAKPAIAWGLTAYAAASTTYFSLLFILALYLQQGLGRSALYSGVALVSWVAAFGVGGPLITRFPPRLLPLAVPLGYALLALSYIAISLCLFRGALSGTTLFVLLGCGGFGLGIGFTGNIRRLTTAVSDRFAPDMSGLINTFSQTAGVAGVATFGTAYFILVPHPAPGSAMHGFAIIMAAFAVTAVLAAIAGYRSSHAPGTESSRTASRC